MSDGSLDTESLLRVTVLLRRAKTMGQGFAAFTRSTRCVPKTVRPSAAICSSAARMASHEFLASTCTTLSVATPTWYVFVKLFLPFWVAFPTPAALQRVPRCLDARKVRALPYGDASPPDSVAGQPGSPNHTPSGSWSQEPEHVRSVRDQRAARAPVADQEARRTIRERVGAEPESDRHETAVSGRVSAKTGDIRRSRASPCVA
jgi:hypothetical protein